MDEQKKPAPPSPVKGHPRKPKLPGKFVELVDLAFRVNDIWKLNTDITLRFITQQLFETLCNRADVSQGGKTNGSGNRKKVTAQLEALDVEIDNSISTLKSYLTSKYKSEAKGRPYYGIFGITSKNGNYTVTKERSGRLEALKLIKTSIVTEGLGNQDLGTKYWTDLYNTYKDLYDKANMLDKNVTDSVNQKKQDKQQVKQTLTSLIGVLEHNHPEDPKGAVRSWGF